MKVLVVGSGGREHCLVWKIRQSPLVSKLFCYPGNPGTLAICDPLSFSYSSVVELVKQEAVDLVVFGPEAPLVEGVSDALRQLNILVVGPSQKAAQLEGSKSFAKEVMIRAGVPTAKHRTVTTKSAAKEAATEFGYPVVFKMDGLAAGKGVIIVNAAEEVNRALDELLPYDGPTLLVEEFLQGYEVSYIVLCDGDRFAALSASQDHKRVADGDLGPNTGGMGAYSDDYILEIAEEKLVDEKIIQPVLETMKAMGTPFQGFLYAGLMMTAEGPKVLEFNTRLGDPETQVLLPRIDGDFVPWLVEAARGKLTTNRIPRKPMAAVTVVGAAEDYPAKPTVGDLIEGIGEAESTGCLVFQAGTRIQQDQLVTAGGRVLAVTATGDDLHTAVECAYRGMEQIQFRGLHFRRDIAAKGLANRHKRV
jgi:phosphoribosylamine---glycine ligase